MTKKQRIACIVAALLLGTLGALGVFLPFPQQPVVEGGAQAVTVHFTNIVISPTTGTPLVITQTGAGGIVAVDGFVFTYTAPLTISGVLTNVRFLYYQAP